MKKPTLADYLAAEDGAFERSEWVNGEIYAMGGASPAHADIVWRLGAVLGPGRIPKGCRVALGDLRVAIDVTGAYVYPDVVLTCDKPHYIGPKPLSLVNPQLVVEVLSPSTRDYDLGGKASHYRLLPSLRAYVVVDPARRAAHVFEREADGSWRLTDVLGGGEARVASMGLVFPLDELFAGLDELPTDDPPPPAR